MTTARGYISLRVKLVGVVLALIIGMSLFLLSFFPGRMDTVAKVWVERRATGVAVVLGAAVSPGLEFDDKEGVAQLLSQVSAAPGLTYLAVTRQDGTVLASWNWNEATTPKFEAEGKDVVLNTQGDMLHVRASLTARGGTHGTLLMGFSLADLEQQRVENLTTVGAVCVVLLLIGLGTAMVVGTLLVRPIQRLTTITSNIVSLGDLTQEIDINTRDEVGQLADSFRQMVDKLRSIPMTLNDMVDGVLHVSEQLSKTAHTVASGTSIVRSRVTDTSRLMAEMLSSLRGIAENVSRLHEQVERSATANQEMVAVTQEVSRSVQAAVTAVESTNRGVEQMTASIQEIARNINLLESSIEETSSAATEMATSVERVESNAKETAQLSELVSKDSEIGEQALHATLGGIDRIRESSHGASQVIGGLGSRISDIGNILDVISEVADQTNLLALNAAIIAAQAGEHGRGFSVVADEIKALAERTAASTKEITDLIVKIQGESENALVAMNEGVRSVDEGVHLGSQAAQTLKKIFDSANRSTTMVRAIANATVEQAQATKRVSTAVHRIVATVQEINAASSAQAKGCDDILRMTHEMEAMTNHVLRSSSEQARGSQQIAQSVESISEMVAEVNSAQQGQTRAAEQAMRAVEIIQGVAEEQAQSVQVLEQAIEALQKRADHLRAAVRQFRV